MEKAQLIAKVSEAVAMLKLLISRGRWKATGKKELLECIADLETIKSMVAAKGKKVDAPELIIRVYVILDRLVSWLDK